jgi:general secretion pathway protein D
MHSSLHSTHEAGPCPAAGHAIGTARNEAARAHGSPLTAFALVLTLTLASTLSLLAPSAFGQALTPNYRDTDIRQVIEAVGAVSGKNFLVDPRVRAQVTLITTTPMSPDTFYQAFLATLAVHGYVAIDDGAVTKIVPDANVRQVANDQPLGVGEGDEFVTQVVKLQNVAAAQLVPILRPLMPQYAQLAAHQQSNMLVVADRASNVDRILAIVRAMDRGADDEVEVIRLENASATETVRMLTQLGQTAQAAGGAPAPQVVADERTNSVLLSGSADGRLRYRGLIAYLDTPTQNGGDTRVRYLNYADAEDLAMKLQGQFGAGAPAAQAAPGAQGNPAAQQPVNIWADPGTNALVINASGKVLQDMMAIIDQIDIPRAQVAVDAIIVEITEEKAAQLGVTWVSDGSGDSPVLGLTNFGSTIGGVVQLAGAAAGDTPSLAALPEGVTLGVGTIRDTGTSWAAILSALSGDATTNVISTPHIVTLDNEEAEIRVGQEVPFLTGQFTNTGAATGAVNPFQTIQREEVGTNLKITPQINEGSGVKLTIEQETSSISAGAQGAVDLVTNKRTITTSVFVEDGQILVLGGLMDDQLRQGEQRVPALGKIPGLGWLFRARKTDRTKTNHMVFIRPTILRNGAQATFNTSSKYNYLRALQLQQAEKPVRLMRGETSPVLPPMEAPGASGGDSGGGAAGAPGASGPGTAAPGGTAPGATASGTTAPGAAASGATGNAAPAPSSSTDDSASDNDRASRRERRRNKKNRRRAREAESGSSISPGGGNDDGE